MIHENFTKIMNCSPRKFGAIRYQPSGADAERPMIVTTDSIVSTGTQLMMCTIRAPRNNRFLNSRSVSCNIALSVSKFENKLSPVASHQAGFEPEGTVS